MSLLLQVNQIYKEFLGVTAVNNLTFSVHGGETFGLLGPNGAGKTTAMRMIMNIIAPDQGTVLLNDEARAKIPNHRFGYLPEERGLYPGANVLEMLTYFGTLNNLSKRKAEVEAIRFLDRLGMVDFTDRKINQLSKGMQQKIQFVAAFLHDPDVLILDEPFSGLDPINQIVLREILEEYKKKNKILIISTHQMEQAEKLCDHICLINQGKVILEGNLNTLKRKNRENAYLLSSDEDLSFLKDFSELTILEEGNNTYKFALNDSKLSVSGILKKVEAQANIRKFEMMEPSLHDIFIQKVQEENGGQA